MDQSRLNFFNKNFFKGKAITTPFYIVLNDFDIEKSDFDLLESFDILEYNQENYFFFNDFNLNRKPKKRNSFRINSKKIIVTKKLVFVNILNF